MKKFDLNFKGDYYDRLILGEPQTPTPEDQVGFEQLDQIGKPKTVAELNTAPSETQSAPTQETSVQ